MMRNFPIMIPQRIQLQQSLHRACCCGCPATVEVVVSGVDAAKCGCVDIGGASQLIDTLLVDGTYELDLISETVSLGKDLCNYRYCYEDSGPGLIANRYTSTDCTGSPTVFNRFATDVGVSIYKENGKVASAYIFNRILCSDGFGFRSFQISFQAFPGLDRGVAIANPLTCLSDTTSNGGTMTVSA